MRRPHTNSGRAWTQIQSLAATRWLGSPNEREESLGAPGKHSQALRRSGALKASSLRAIVEIYSPSPQLVRCSPRKTLFKPREGFSKTEHGASARYRAITCSCFAFRGIDCGILAWEPARPIRYAAFTRPREIRSLSQRWPRACFGSFAPILALSPACPVLLRLLTCRRYCLSSPWANSGLMRRRRFDHLVDIGELLGQPRFAKTLRHHATARPAYLIVVCTAMTDVPEAFGPLPVALMAKVSLPLYLAFVLYS